MTVPRREFYDKDTKEMIKSEVIHVIFCLVNDVKELSFSKLDMMILLDTSD